MPQTVYFAQPQKARFIKIDATTPDAAAAIVEMEEIGVSLN